MYRMKRVIENHILDLDSLDSLKLVLELANTAYCDAQAVVEVRVLERDIGAVRFE